MKKTAQDVTMDLLTDNSRTVDFTKMITEQLEFVRKAQRIAGSKPSKVESAYIEEQAAKLTQLEDIVRSWIFEAFAEDNNDFDYSTVQGFGNIKQNYTITVVVEKK
jgi:hypothetical protein